MRLPFAIPPAGSRRFDVVGLGENCVDHYCVVPGLPAPGGKVRMSRHEVQGGGQVASAMLACQRLGLRARYLGRCGDDAESRAGVRELREAGVEVSGVRVLRGERSQLSIILVDEATGERAIAWTQGAALALQPEELVPEEVRDARVLHVDVTSPGAAAQAVALARAAGVVTSIDADHEVAGLRELLAAIDLCVLPEDFACALTGVGAEDPLRVLLGLRRLCPSGLLVITRGARGCAALRPGAADGPAGPDAAADRGALLLVPAFPVRPVDIVDTTGCGDAFHAALVAALCHQGPDERHDHDQPLLAALRFACAAAALNTRRLGARPGLPTYDEVAALLGPGAGRIG